MGEGEGDGRAAVGGVWQMMKWGFWPMVMLKRRGRRTTSCGVSCAPGCVAPICWDLVLGTGSYYADGHNSSNSSNSFRICLQTYGVTVGGNNVSWRFNGCFALHSSFPCGRICLGLCFDWSGLVWFGQVWQNWESEVGVGERSRICLCSGGERIRDIIYELRDPPTANELPTP